MKRGGREEKIRPPSGTRKPVWVFGGASGVGTIRENRELGGSAEGALAADVQVDGGEAEIVAGVVGLGSGQVQVPGGLGHKPAARAPLQEVGELVDEPAVGQSWRGGAGSKAGLWLRVYSSVDTWVMWGGSAGQEGSRSFVRRLGTPAVSREVVQICRGNREDEERTAGGQRDGAGRCPTHTQTSGWQLC